MNAFLWIVFSMAIAAAIGGFTNYLAIKMLFHPRHPIVIKGKKLPFTPGLIPKRKEEIASSLGLIVGEHLVTSKGLLSVLHSPKIKTMLENKLHQWIRKVCESERTLEEELLRLMTPAQLETIKVRLNEFGKAGLINGFKWLRSHFKLDTKLVSEWLQMLPEEQVEAWTERGAQLLLQTVREELLSIRGERLIKQAVERFFQQQTGFFGALAGAVVDTQKLTWRIQDTLVEVLSAKETEQYVVKAIDSKLREWEQKSISELLHSLTGKDPFAWLEEHYLPKIEPVQLLNLAFEQPLNRLIGQWKEQLQQKVPAVSAWLLEKAGQELERVVAAFDLPALVQAEVNKFPIERVESVILSVTGREFRAITWLGAVIGGLIGLVQSILYLAVGHI